MEEHPRKQLLHIKTCGLDGCGRLYFSGTMCNMLGITDKSGKVDIQFDTEQNAVLIRKAKDDK